MISRISGKLDSVEEEYLVIEINNIFYQVFIPSYLQEKIRSTKTNSDEILLYTINYIEGGFASGTMRPRLIGFLSEIEKEFFEKYITVKGLGEKKALKSLTVPVSRIAKAIEIGDKGTIRSLPGIGSRMADMIVAELKGKMSKFALLKDDKFVRVAEECVSIREEVIDVLLQLGYKSNEAQKMIEEALLKHPDCEKAEDLVNHIFKGRK